MIQTVAADSRASRQTAPPEQWGTLPTIAALVVIMIGLGALIGWATGASSLLFLKLEPNAAMAFVFCGFSLLMVQGEPIARWRRWFVMVCAGLITLLALLTMVEHLIDGDLGIDQLLHSLTTDPATAAGRLVPTIALCFALAGSSLLLLTQISPWRLVAALRMSFASMVAGFGVVAILGSAIDAVFGFPGWNFTGTSLSTAVPFLLLGLGLVAVTARRHDWSWALEQGTTVCFVAGMILLVAVCAVTYRALNTFADTAARVAKTHEVQAQTGHLQRALIDAAAARRLYLISPDMRQVEIMRQALVRAQDHLATIRRLTAGNPRQQEHTAELDRMLIAPLARAMELLEKPNSIQLTPPASTQGAAPARPQFSNEELLNLLGRINAEEQERLQGLQQVAKRNFEFAVAVVPAGTFGSVLLLSVALFLLNREASDRKRAQAEQLDSEERYRLLFESSPLPKWVFDLETLRFSAVNAATISFYGYTREEFLSMSITDIRPPEEVQPLLEVVAAPATEGRFKSSRIWRHRKKDGTIVLMEITTHDLLFGGRSARLVLANDVTARVQAEDEIRQLNAELELRVRQRTAQLEGAIKEIESFSYSVSHDLRAPLRHVQGYVAMLQEATVGQLSPKAQRHLKIINDASVQMGQLIDDLLEFSRMGRVDMSEGRVVLDDLLRETLHGLEMATQGRKIAWKISALPTVVGDRAMIRQVLTNLLGNAIKYSRQRDLAEIEVGCSGEEDGRAIVFVRDNGAGFDMEYAHKLFGVFQRLHRSDEFEGTGIGLATVRRVVSRHGGRVWAEAAVGKGATFYFTLRHVPENSTQPVIA